MMPLLIIHPKDLLLLDNICYDTARRRIQRVRVHLGKAARAPITVTEYCRFYYFNEAEVRAALRRS